MSTPAQPQVWYQNNNVMLGSPSVDVSKLDRQLVSFLTALGAAHRALFMISMILTSGNDGKHVTGSAHYLNKAVDIRSHDLSDEQAAIFSLVLGYFARVYSVAVFDERFTVSPHWHIQTADSVGG